MDRNRQKEIRRRVFETFILKLISLIDTSVKLNFLMLISRNHFINPIMNPLYIADAGIHIPHTYDF